MARANQIVLYASARWSCKTAHASHTFSSKAFGTTTFFKTTTAGWPIAKRIEVKSYAYNLPEGFEF
jgi:hypothetical protein